MKKSVILAVGTISFLAVALAAASVSNLAGTWVLDKSKSDAPAMGRGGQAAPDRDITMIIEQKENELLITRKTVTGGDERTVDNKFTLDGKPSTNPSEMGRGEYTAAASWKGDALVIQGSQKLSTQMGEFEISIRDEYTLSSDGQVLTLTSTRSMPQGERTTKQVFNKQ